jgi:hypothetical protein
METVARRFERYKRTRQCDGRDDANEARYSVVEVIHVRQSLDGAAEWPPRPIDYDDCYSTSIEKSTSSKVLVPFVNVETRKAPASAPVVIRSTVACSFSSEIVVSYRT